jgi:AraC-like DNA-binding protein
MWNVERGTWNVGCGINGAGAACKQRWQIARFFKWIKQNLKIKTFLGTSKNAVMAQIRTTLIYDRLLSCIKFTTQAGMSRTTMARRVKSFFPACRRQVLHRHRRGRRISPVWRLRVKKRGGFPAPEPFTVQLGQRFADLHPFHPTGGGKFTKSGTQCFGAVKESRLCEVLLSGGPRFHAFGRRKNDDPARSPGGFLSQRRLN